jgi:hypothetical protein
MTRNGPRSVGFDVAPLIGGLGIANRSVSQPEQIWATIFGIAGGAALGDFREAQCAQFADRWRYRMAMQSILNELIEGDGQISVVPPTVVCELDFHA